MKHSGILICTSIILFLTGCRFGIDNAKLLADIRHKVESGDLKEARYEATYLKKYTRGGEKVYREADSLTQIAERIAIDFSLTEKEADAQIEKRTGSLSVSEKEKLETRGWLEFRKIDGHKMYFKRAVSNMILLKDFYKSNELVKNEKTSDPEMILSAKHTKEIIDASQDNSQPVIPINMKITYTITVHRDEVPAGDTLRCWMPWPRADNIRQTNINLLSTSCNKYLISPDSSTHSTVYMEKVQEKGTATLFSISYTYRSSGQHFRLHDHKIMPYDKESQNYRLYTMQQLPQISFSDKVKHLADSLVGNETKPDKVVRKLYMWFKENIPWAGALEYSIMADIPQYVIKNMRGDCGMQTLLFMSMARYKGIPVRWQSGWMVPPQAENLHDWCEVYYEGVGWVPVDVTYDLQKSDNSELKEFYLSGIDGYRLIVNKGISGRLYPEKRFMRSEPYDFQRGEVEWKKGNLYFDKWDYNMDIEYLK